MICKKQLDIFKVFKKDLFRSISFSDLKKELKEKSSSKLQRSIINFKEENLINFKNVGKTKLISLNFENNLLFDYLSIFDLGFYKKMPFGVLYKIQNELLKETEFFSLIVFGSYTMNEQKINSDLDVAVIVDNEELKKRISPRIASVRRKEVIEIHCMVFTRDEFLEMLRSDEENLGKEIARKNFVFYGAVNFYKLILKGGRWKA